MCQPKVEDLDTAVIRDHKVPRFQIPVDDAFLVRGRRRVREGNRDLEKLVESESVFRKKRRQRLPFHELHGDEVDGVRLFDGVDGHDVGVVESCDRFRFSLELRPPLLAPGQLRRENLERYLSIQLRVLG